MDAELAVMLLLGLIDRAATFGALLSKAKAEGRDISSEELDAFAQADDLAREGLVAAIAKVKAAQ